MPAKQILPLVLNNLGAQGLNTQASPSALDPTWLAAANNVVLDEQGRIATRKGIQQVTNNLSSGEHVQSIFEYAKADGSKIMICGSDSNIYTINQATTPYTLTAVTRAGTPQTITSGHWEWVNFNTKVYGVQNGHTPVRYDGTTWYDLVDLGSYNPPAGITTFDPSCILGEYGRLWVGGMTEKNNVIYYSDTLQGDKWNTGAAGQVDLKTVWGGDRIMAIHAFMGKLVIFGTENIAIYNNPEDPTTLALDEVIEGVGLSARDSVKHLGDDLLFLSNTGVRSLARTVTSDGKMPLRDFSKNIRDELSLMITTADMDQCKAGYCLCGGFYLLSFPDKNVAYYFDFTILNQDTTPRITKFNFSEGDGIYALRSTVDGTMWIGRNDTGHVAQYKNYWDSKYTDVTATYGNESACTAAKNIWDSTGSKCWRTDYSSYDSSFKTVWLDFGDPSTAKILKKFHIVVEGGSGMDVSFTYYRDYSSIGTNQNFTLRSSVAQALWGSATSLFGSSVYTPQPSPREYKLSLGKSAKEVQFEMVGSVKGNKASLQNVTALAKPGKIR